MKKTVFMKMLEIEKGKEKLIDELELGDYFLYGNSVIGQKQNKMVGQSLSYYEVIRKQNGNVEYAPVFDYMEKDLEEEEK